MRFVAFAENHDGEVYFLDQDGGTVHTIEKNTAASKPSNFPTKLSTTGLFASVKDHKSADGVARFTINSQQSQDRANKKSTGLPSRDFFLWPRFTQLESRSCGLVDWHNFRCIFRTTPC